jgi:hypothetical protein
MKSLTQLLWGTAAAMLTGCMAPGTIGSPQGASVRAGDYIVTLISAQEPHMIEISGRGTKGNGYRISLLLISVKDGSRRVVPVGRNIELPSLSIGGRILGDDPARGMVWFQVHEDMAYDYRNHRLFHERELPRGGGPPNPARLSDPSSVAKYLDDAGPELRAKYTRASYIRGSAPGLYTYLTKPGLYGTVVIASTNWTLETGLYRLDQILPDPEHLAVIGTKPPIPDKLSEPFLMLIDTRTGQASTHSLWVQ